MKSILSSLIKKSPAQADPLAWMKDLAQLDESQGLKLSTQHLSELLSHSETASETLYKVTLIADQENRARIHHLTRQYTQFDRLRDNLAAELQDTVYFYCRQLSSNYRKLVLDYLQSEDSVPPFPEKQFPLVLGRAILANITMSKWRHYQQQPTAEFAWQSLHALFNLAESRGYADISFQAYKDEAEINLTSAYISACMLGSLDHATMTKHEIELVSELLNIWGKSLRLSRLYHPKKHIFYVDFEEDQPARRIRLLDESDSKRYWELDFIAAKIELALYHVENNQLDRFAEIQAVSHYPQLAPLLQMLKSEWSRHDYQRQRRAEERREVAKSAILSYGMELVTRKFKLHQNSHTKNKISENSLEDRLLHNRGPIKNAPNVLFEDAMQTRWIVANESKSGYGITLTESLPNEMKLGKLVGMVIDGDKNNMVLAIVRSIKNIGGQYHVGLKVIAKQAFHVDVAMVASPNGQHADLDLPLSGLYIGEEDGLSMWPSLILPKLRFQENAIYNLTIFNEKKSVRLGKPIESRDDWVRVNWPD